MDSRQVIKRNIDELVPHLEEELEAALRLQRLYAVDSDASRRNGTQTRMRRSQVKGAQSDTRARILSLLAAETLPQSQIDARLGVHSAYHLRKMLKEKLVKKTAKGYALIPRVADQAA